VSDAGAVVAAVFVGVAVDVVGVAVAGSVGVPVSLEIGASVVVLNGVRGEPLTDEDDVQPASAIMASATTVSV
jgi:hypothetical protein